MNNFKPTWLMIKRHKVTGLKYFCKTVKKCPYKYNGSGLRWSNHLKIHGKDVETLWCELFTDKQFLTNYAIEFSISNNIVESEEWANLVIENGISGWPTGTKQKESSKKLMSKGHLGKKSGPEHLQAVSKPVEIKGVIYNSMKDASRILGIKYVTLRARILSTTVRFMDYKFVGIDKQVSNKRKKVEIDGVFYPNARQASKTLKIKYKLLLYRVSSPNYPEYREVLN